MAKPTFDQLTIFHRLAESDQITEEDFSRFLLSRGKPSPLQIASGGPDILEVNYDLGVDGIVAEIKKILDPRACLGGYAWTFGEKLVDTAFPPSRSGKRQVKTTLLELDHPLPMDHVPDVPGYKHTDVFTFLTYILKHPLSAIRNQPVSFGSTCENGHGEKSFLSAEAKHAFEWDFGLYVGPHRFGTHKGIHSNWELGIHRRILVEIPESAF